MSAPAAIGKWTSLVEKCRHPDIPLNLLLAICWQESSGDRWAIRYEPGYQYFYNHQRKKALYDAAHATAGNRAVALKDLGATEFHAQSTSYGLLQLMGATAREYGFRGKYLTELCDPEQNIAYGCLYFWKYCLQEGGSDAHHALLKYNGGGNRNYADEVLAKLNAIES